MPQTKKTNDQSMLFSLLAMTGSMTFFFVSPIILCIWLGKFLDTTFQTTPIFIGSGALIGFIMGITSVMFFLKKIK